MSYVDRTISELFRDTRAREVVDLTALLHLMSADYARGRIDVDGIRSFLLRNRAFLQAVVDLYARERVGVDELVDRLVDAVVLDASLKPGRSISQVYLMSVGTRGKPAGRAREEPEVL